MKFVKRDVVLWLRHLEEAGLHVPSGCGAVFRVGDRDILFEPMRPGPSGRPTPGLRTTVADRAIWSSIPLGAVVDLELVRVLDKDVAAPAGDVAKPRLRGADKATSPSRADEVNEFFNSVELPPSRASAFDAYLMVDWSAASAPKTGKDSVWWCLCVWRSGRLVVETNENSPTRQACLGVLRAQLRDLAAEGSSVLVGFDFPYGYDCMRSRGIKSGREARAVCAAGPSQGDVPAAQSVTFTVCDAGDTALYVARVIHVESILVGEAYVASGWYRIEPKACKVVYDSEKAMGNTVFLAYMYRDTSDVLRNITPPPGSPVGGPRGSPLRSVRERFCVRPGEAFNYKAESKTEAETCQLGFTLANFIDSFDPSGYTSGNQTVTVAVDSALHTHPVLSVAAQTGYLLNGRKVTLNALGQWVYENGHLIAKELIVTRTGRPNLQPGEQASYIQSPVREPYKDIEQVFRSVKPCIDDSSIRHSDFLFGMTESGVVSASSASTAGSSRFEFSYYAVLANLDFANVGVSARNECYVVNVLCKGMRSACR